MYSKRPGEPRWMKVRRELSGVVVVSMKLGMQKGWEFVHFETICPHASHQSCCPGSSNKSDLLPSWIKRNS